MVHRVRRGDGGAPPACLHTNSRRRRRRLKIQAETGEIGRLSSAFGKGGKFRVTFEQPTLVQPGGKLYLVYKKYAFSNSKALHQDSDCVVPADELEVGKPARKKTIEPPPPPPVAVEKKTEDVREGVVERLKGDPLEGSARYRTVIVEGLFSAEEDQKTHIGFRVETATGDVGSLAGPFGKAGKSKVDFEDGTDAAVGAACVVRLPA